MLNSFKIILITLIFLSGVQGALAQSTEADLLGFEKQIDNAIVAADIPFLERAYADDFRFKHGTGYVDSKASWLKDVMKNKGAFVSRTLDSVEVEIHHQVGITNGKLTVVRKDRSYRLKYVRVYVWQNSRWQMIMHRTVQEFDN